MPAPAGQPSRPGPMRSRDTKRPKLYSTDCTSYRPHRTVLVIKESFLEEGRIGLGKEDGEKYSGERQMWVTEEAGLGLAGAGAGRRAALWHLAAPDNMAILLGPGYGANRGDCNVHSIERAKKRRMGQVQESGCWAKYQNATSVPGKGLTM